MIAQTNLQLYQQLREGGIEDSELERVHAAYELGVQLLTGKYRKSHRHFTEHLVGMASLVAAVDGRADMVRAALVHAAYHTGDWGTGGGRPVGESERAAVREVVGVDAEDLIWRYTQVPVGFDEMRAWTEQACREPSPRTVDVLVLLLANFVEELQDEPDDVTPVPRIAMLAQAATAMGVGDVAERLVDLAKTTNALRAPAALGDRSYPRNEVLPRSARPALRLRARRALRRRTWRGFVRRLQRLRNR